MKSKLINNKQDREIVAKKIYTPPTLIMYGKLTELTASGSQLGSEGGGSGNN